MLVARTVQIICSEKLKKCRKELVKYVICFLILGSMCSCKLVDNRLGGSGSESSEEEVEITYCEESGRTSNTPYANSGEAGVDGATDATAYAICTGVQMNSIGLNSTDWASFFDLKNNIDLSAYTGMTYNRIGDAVTKYSGTFDGGGFTISNFSFDDGGSNEDDVGLFGYISGATITNFLIDSATISANNQTAVLIGVLHSGNVNISSVTIQKSSVTGSDFTAGFIATSWAGTITMDQVRFSNSALLGRYDIGGLFGDTSIQGSVTNCYSSGSIGEVAGVGGDYGSLAGGIWWDISFKNCHGNMTISAPNSSQVGGLIGRNFSTGIPYALEESSFIGNIIGVNYVAGLVGDSRGNIRDSYFLGDVIGATSVGGLVGDASASNDSIINSYAIGNVTGTGYVGGLVGSCWDPNVDITNSFAVVNVVGSDAILDRVGKIIGRRGTVAINNTFSSNTTTCTDNGGGGCNAFGPEKDLVTDPLYYFKIASDPLNLWTFPTIWVSSPTDYPSH